MAIPSYTVVCTEKIEVAPGVFELRFTKPEGFSFKAGQFILLDVPLVKSPSDIQPRAYSIASTPNESELIFVVKVKVGGRFGDYLKAILKKGTSMTMKGPFGLFTLTTKPHDIVFAATGAGIAPFRSHILHALSHGETRRLDLFFGVRNPEDFFWLETFQALREEHAHFHIHPCLSGNDTSWVGSRGRIQSFIPSAITKKDATELYICGAPEMVADIKKLALEAWGLPKTNVHAEGFM